MPRKQYDVFNFTPGSRQKMYCRVCETECRVERNRFGYTCSAAAMVKVKRYHDRFLCPYSHTEWHEQALAIMMEIEQTASPRLVRLLQQDLKAILANKKRLT